MLVALRHHSLFICASLRFERYRAASSRVDPLPKVSCVLVSLGGAAAVDPGLLWTRPLPRAQSVQLRHPGAAPGGDLLVLWGRGRVRRRRGRRWRGARPGVVQQGQQAAAPRLLLGAETMLVFEPADIIVTV